MVVNFRSVLFSLLVGYFLPIGVSQPKADPTLLTERTWVLAVTIVAVEDPGK